MVIIYIVPLFIALSVFIESIGVWFRFIGAVNNESASGYSTHVRIATMGRFFILLSAPLLGMMTDSGVNSSALAIVASISFFLVFIFMLVSDLDVFKNKIVYIYNMVNKTDHENIFFKYNEKISNPKFSIVSIFSFLLTASGILVVNYCATIFPDQRAMIVQMSAFVTMLGSLVHVFYIDPILAKTCDKNHDEALNFIKLFLASRKIASVILMLIFFLLYLL